MSDVKVKTQSKRRIYIVTGAAGHLGSTLMRELSARGCEARGLLHTVKNVQVEGEGISYYAGNICEPDSLRPLFSGTEDCELIVIHAAALIILTKKLPPEAYEVNVNGTKNILRLCKEYNVKRLVYVSSVHAIPELPKGQQIREVESFSAGLVQGGYAKSKVEAAQAVADAVAEGMDVVTVFPSGIIGPYDDGKAHMTQMVKSYMQGKLPASVKGGYDFVDVRDVASGCLLAAELGRAGEGYILSGAYCRVERLLALVSKECGRKTVPALPIWLARVAVPFVGLYTTLAKKRPLYTAYSLYTLSSNGNFSNEKARRELGYSPRDIGETVHDMVEWLKNGKLE